MQTHAFTAALAAATLLASSALAGSPQSESIDFILKNQTGHVLVQLFISLPSTDSWEEDILGEDVVVGAGESVEVSIDDGLPECVYDIRADFDDGDSVQVARVNFCELDGEDLVISE